MERVANHSFHPLREGFTFDRTLDKPGIASLQDDDWKVRSLAVRDLLRIGPAAGQDLVAQLNHTNLHVRQVCVMTLGLLRYARAVNALQTVLEHDTDSVVRSQATIGLGEMGSKSALGLLQSKSKADPSRDVRHQCELAVYRIEHNLQPEPELARGHLGLDDVAKKTKLFRIVVQSGAWVKWRHFTKSFCSPASAAPKEQSSVPAALGRAQPRHGWDNCGVIQIPDRRHSPQRDGA